MSDTTPHVQPSMATRTMNLVVLWKLAILRLFLYCFVADYTTFSTAMRGSVWSDLGSFDKWMTVGGIMALNATIWIAFIDKTTRNLESGTALPPDPDGGTPNGGTAFYKRTIQQTQSETIAEKQPAPATPPPATGAAPSL